MVGFRESLELSSRGSLVVGISDWLSESDRCRALVGLPWMDMSPNQSLAWVARDVSEGATTTTKDVMSLEWTLVVEVLEGPPLLRGNVRVCSSEGLLHLLCVWCTRDLVECLSSNL